MKQREQPSLSVRAFLFVVLTLGGVVAIAAAPLEASDPQQTLLEVVSGDNQSGVVSRELPVELEVRLTSSGKAVPGATIEFRLVASPAGAREDGLPPPGPFPLEAVTDEEGIARAKCRLGSVPGIYIVTATFLGDGRPMVVTFTAEARREDWLIFVIFGILGSLAIFLYGIRGMSDGFQKLAGDRIKRWLAVLTTNRFLGVFAGIGISSILQSSAAASAMLIGFTGAGLVSLVQALAVIIGGKIGTTITAQLIALRLTDYALLFVGIGFLLRVVSKRQGYRHAGQAILGFGLLFLGIKLISEVVAPLTTSEPVLKALSSVEDLKTGIVIGMLFTILVQSSGATIGVVIALSANGLVGLDTAIPIIYGASLGSGVSVLIASLGAKREGKRVALGHLVIAILGVAIVAPFSEYHKQVALFLAPVSTSPGRVATEAAAQQIACAQLVYSVAVAVVLIPLVKVLAVLLEKLLPGAPASDRFKPEYLDNSSFKFPSLALEQAQRETVRMAGIARVMVEKAILPFTERDKLLLQELAYEDDKVDILRHAITRFLTTLSSWPLTEQESKRQITLLRVVAKLEDIGDIVVREILHLATKFLTQGLHFSAEGLQQIRDYHWEIVGTLDTVITAVRTNDPVLARRLIDNKVHIVEREKELHRAHIERLCKGMQESVSTSSIHLDLLTNLRRVNSHVVDVAYALMDEHG